MIFCRKLEVVTHIILFHQVQNNEKSEIGVGYHFILHLLYNKVFMNFCENVFGYDVWCPLFITWVTGFHRACLHVVWFRLQWNAELCSTLTTLFRHLQDFSLALNDEFMINIAAFRRFAFLVMWFHYMDKLQLFCKHLFVVKWKTIDFLLLLIFTSRYSSLRNSTQRNGSRSHYWEIMVHSWETAQIKLEENVEK